MDGLTPQVEPLRVIFLDVDGVLHSADVPGGGAAASNDGLFWEPCMRRLKEIVDQTSAVIVLSSSWRLDPHSLSEVTQRLLTWDMQIFDTTSREACLGCLSRAEEIVQWIRNRRDCLESFVVLDDLDLTESLGSRSCIIVKGTTGLVDEDVHAAIQILGRKEVGNGNLPAQCDIEAALLAFDTAESHRPAWRQRWEQLEMERAERRREKKHKKQKSAKKDRRSTNDKSNPSLN